MGEESQSLSEPLLRSAERGDISTLQDCILNSGNIEAQTTEGHTALYLACQKGNVDCVKVLLENKAQLKYETNNYKKCNCLNAAIDAEQRNVIKCILNAPKVLWMEAFQDCSSSNNEDDITPLRKLIKKMPKMAKLVLDKCCKKVDKVDETDNYLYTQVDYDYELLEDYQDLYHESGNSAVEHYTYHNHPLYLMVHYKRKELLAHELVSSFICLRWNVLLKYIYYANLLTYIFLMLLLTIYMHLYFLSAQKYADLTNNTLINCSKYDDDMKLEAPIPALRITLITIAALIVIICLFRMLTELSQMVANPKEYFFDFLNYAEIFLYISTIAFVCNGDFTCLNSWRWQLGAICIFLSWLNFVFFLRLQPKFGIYVIMFEEIISTFLKVLPLAVLLIFAFGQPFFILLRPISTEADPLTRPFSTLPYSLVKTLTMMIGEFETDPLLYSVPSILLFPFTTFGLWIIFVLVMSILLQNLLVGLAVDNIKGIQKQAKFKRQVAQVKFLLTLMSSLLFKKLKVLRCCMKTHKQNPRRYTKTRGRLHPFGYKSFKHRVSNLVNFAWKPEKFNEGGVTRNEILEKLEVINAQIQCLSKSVMELHPEDTEHR